MSESQSLSAYGKARRWFPEFEFLKQVYRAWNANPPRADAKQMQPPSGD